MWGDRRSSVALTFVLVGLCCIGASCLSRDEERNTELLVFAAASLTAAFDDIVTTFEGDHPSVRVAVNHAGTHALATQIRSGAPADVFASAHPAIMTDLKDDGLVEQPERFATNGIVVGVAKGVESIGRFSDLLSPGVRISMGVDDVPIGRYTTQCLTSLDLWEAIQPRIVSRELDVKGIVGKLVLGEVDAGFVYQSDLVALSHEDISTLRPPESCQPDIAYSGAVTRQGPNPLAARAFVRFVTSATARRILEKHGFS